VCTTTARQAGELAAFLGGFIAGEGYFGRSGRTFTCSVALGAADSGACELIHDFLQVGRVHRYPRRRDHFDDEVVWVVRSLPNLVDVVVPFLDEHLPASYKRQQFLAWRAELMEYWHTRARRRRRCTIDGCERPHRARGLCRGHYYAAYGR
jgi:hypothetical protein